jgi:hypothetical protein
MDMKIRKILLVFLVASCAFGLEVKPDSLSLTVELLQNMYKALNTITLYNTTSDQIQIDTVFIKFLNGDSTDFKRGQNCDSSDWSCYNYGGWTYGGVASSTIIIALRYMKDSLFFMGKISGGPIEYTIPPHDSLQFSVRIITNCSVCDRMPSFPATTKFQYSFIARNGQKASFLLKLNEPTHVAPVQIPHHYLPAGRRGALYNLRGQKMNDGSPIGILIRNNKTYFRLDWNARKLNGN